MPLYRKYNLPYNANNLFIEKNGGAKFEETSRDKCLDLHKSWWHCYLIASN